jgi:DNA integrity scanning protein DisA with diadenylate cyclase activity
VKQEIIISTEELLPEFQNHLSYENNYRILFTAPYGTGKSTFLNEFFKKKDNYFTINLYPVNYSVSANEDVFELIKFDIILQLLEKYPEQIKLQKEEFSLLLRSQVFIQEKLKFMPLFLAILGMVGKIGQSAKGLIDAAKKVNTEFKDFSKESSYDEQKTIEQYISDEGNKKGSIY